ncbi:MAG TPA: hypothetical protein VJ729_03220 [Nitrososphaeraceae archaeon]|nr:hypothetical protein [Nitrososphaeraceae archaeon]
MSYLTAMFNSAFNSIVNLNGNQRFTIEEKRKEVKKLTVYLNIGSDPYEVLPIIMP